MVAISFITHVEVTLRTVDRTKSKTSYQQSLDLLFSDELCHGQLYDELVRFK